MCYLFIYLFLFFNILCGGYLMQINKSYACICLCAPMYTLIYYTCTGLTMYIYVYMYCTV